MQPERQPGDFMLIKTRYLDPEDGWVPLIDYDGDIELVTTAAMQALHKLQTELSCAAVHGNLRASNIFVRCAASCGRTPASLVAPMHKLCCLLERG